MQDMSVTRRSFLNTSLVAACGAATSSSSLAQGGAGGSSILDRTGVALFTVRDLMKDPAVTLKAIADLGYQYVEGGVFPSLAPALKAAGLKQASAYAPTYLVTGNRQAWATPGAGELLPESYTWQQAVDESKARASSTWSSSTCRRPNAAAASTTTRPWPASSTRPARPARRPA